MHLLTSVPNPLHKLFLLHPSSFSYSSATPFNILVAPAKSKILYFILDAENLPAEVFM